MDFKLKIQFFSLFQNRVVANDSQFKDKLPETHFMVQFSYFSMIDILVSECSGCFGIQYLVRLC
jgi:hypothetical protein